MSLLTHRSITPVLAVILVVMSTAVLSLSGFFAFRALQHAAIGTLKEHSAINAQSLADALVLPLYNFDEPQARLILESQMRDRAIVGLRIHPATGKGLSLFRPGIPELSAEAMAKQGFLVDVHEIRRGETDLGSVETFSTLKFMEEDLGRVRATFTMGIIIFDIILVLGLYLLLWRIVVRPLRALERYAKEVSYSGQTIHESASVPPFLEVENLHHSIERMVTLLDQRYLTLQESEKRFHALFDSSNDPVFVSEFISFEVPPHFVEVNEAACRTLGYTREELLAIGMNDITPETLRTTVESARRKLVDLGTIFFECTFRTKSGKEVPVEINASRFTFAGRIYLLSVARDLSERQHLEAQLRHSQKMESLGVLTGGIAHDFNNILQVIISYASLLEDKLPEGDPNRYELAQILAASQKASRLTRSLLVFSRKEAIEPALIDLNALAGRMDSFLKRVIGEDIDLAVHLGGAPLYVFADENQIEQVLLNLATNARDAMPKGGTLIIKLEEVVIDLDFIRIHGFGSPGPWARISVSDSGIGMDEATRQRVFDPFFTTKAPGKGTGLGLATAYGIISQHKGSISVYSVPGRGTTFQIHLPISNVESALAFAPIIQEQERLQGTETILVVEDEEPLREAIAITLEKWGYTVIQAKDGQEAVEQYEAHAEQIDLLLMDMIMPRLCGKDAFDTIRSKHPGIKVLFTSGYTADIIQSRGELDQSMDLLMKPVVPIDLLKKIRSILDR